MTLDVALIKGHVIEDARHDVDNVNHNVDASYNCHYHVIKIKLFELDTKYPVNIVSS